MTQRQGGYCNIWFFPATPMTWSLEVPLELTQCSSRELNLASYIASRISEVRGHRQVVPLNADVPGHRQKQVMQTLIVYLFKTMIFEYQKAKN